MQYNVALHGVSVVNISQGGNIMATEKNTNFNKMVGERVKIARKKAGMTQQQLSQRLNFKDRQILSNIESGFRKVSSDELLSLMNALQKPLDYFTDPYLLTEEKILSWRAQNVPALLDEYEKKARKLIASYKRFANLLGKEFYPVFQTIPLNKKSSFEDAWRIAESLVENWGLGDFPAEKLPDIISEKLNIHVLYVDCPMEISGATCSIPEFYLILINRREPFWRRNFDLAHELFHVLTKDTITPPQIDIPYPDQGTAPREEKLADNFAAALLMPRKSLKPCWDEKSDMEIHSRINAVAAKFGVSGIALYWRLLNLNWLIKDIVREINFDRLKNYGSKPEIQGGETPRLYSEVFVENLYQVLDKGLVSLRKTAELLDCNIEEIEDLFGAYGKSALV
jgi:Zn-dependent peptidase ImmA (M78 family)/DNA-binding transcriptional regulator YiaG